MIAGRRRRAALVAAVLLLAAGAAPVGRNLSVAVPTTTARPGTLREGLLTLTLDAMLTMWHPHGVARAGTAQL